MRVETRKVTMAQCGLNGVLAAMLALAAGIAPGAAQAQIPGDMLKVGVLSDMSGPFASQAGPGSVAAAQLAAGLRQGGRRPQGRDRLRRSPEQARCRRPDRPQ